MSILSFFKPDINNTELAEQLFSTQILGENINKKYLPLIKKILKECTPKGDTYPERQQVLLKVIELIGEPKTSQERFIVAKSYAWSRANFRPQAIKYLSLYLNNPLYEMEINKFSGISHDEALKNHLTEMYGYLGKAYIGEYNFDEALKIYEYLINQFPNDPLAYMGKCEVLIKQNKLLDCHQWLVNCQKLPYYKFNKNYAETDTENWFYFTINRLLKDVNEKINKNYKYSPRKTKND